MIANVKNNLANVVREQGDLERAAGLYADALRVYGDYADSWALAFLFEDVAAVAAAVGDAERALRLRSGGAARGDRDARSPTDAETLARALAPALRAARARPSRSGRSRPGARWGCEAALEEALEVCAPRSPADFIGSATAAVRLAPTLASHRRRSLLLAGRARARRSGGVTRRRR